MKFLDYLFHGKELRYIDSYFKMLNGYSPTFTSYNGGVYEMDLTRTAVNSFATHCSKLKPEIEGSALKSLEKTLQHKPNYFMDTTKFIKRLATYVAVEHTAFIIPIEDEYGRLCGWYPLRAQRCEVVEAAGQVYLRYLFENGEHGAIEFERVGIMTDFEYTDDLFGEDNRTLKPTMQLIHTQNEGIINAVKNSANIRFLAKVANMLKPEDIKKERQRFTEDNLSADNDNQIVEKLESTGMILALVTRTAYKGGVSIPVSTVKPMVKNNCGSAAGTKRRFPLLAFLAQETIDGVAVEYANEVYAQLGQEVKARAQAGKLGYDILLNERERLFGFYLYKGNDLTATNTEGNTPCIFSRDFDNVNEQEYTASIENCGNFIYVQGAADDNGSQPVTTVDGEGATGLDLVEVFCDATDIARKYQQGETEVTIPLNTYIAMLKTRGGAELENYGKNINFVSTINTNSNLKFKADFDLGDRITCKETKWGIQIDARITEVTETYQKGEETIEATFGDSLPTLVDQIRKVR